jgi:putative transposase
VCKDHLVWIPQDRKTTRFGDLRRELGPVLRDRAQHRESEIEAGHLLRDQVHRLLTSWAQSAIAIPPKDAVSQVVGYRKGKRALPIARTSRGRQRNFTGAHCWARGS